MAGAGRCAAARRHRGGGRRAGRHRRVGRAAGVGVILYPGGVLEAKRAGFWKGDYELSADGRPLTRWDAKTWRGGGSFELDGRRYEVRAVRFGSRYELV